MERRVVSEANRQAPLSQLDFNVLLVLASGAPLYGYAIMKRLEEHPAGPGRVEIGSLYRVLSRLMDGELVEEAAAPADAPANHRGLPRKYYRITAAGESAARAEARRLEGVVRLARDLLPGSRP
jgi:DNA-binding PadR family transcriptional regulator